MAALHEALQCLGPITWDEVPQSPDAQREFLSDIFRKARLIVDSVPEPPPPPSSTSANSDKSHTSKSSSSSKRSYHVAPSSARADATDPEILALQKEWGKPIKMNNAKENPLGIPLYRLNGSDGRGAWFGRRSVHEGLPFSRWKAKMSDELPESLRVNRERVRQGRAPDHSVRGIGAEDKVEEIEVTDADGRTVLGRLEVYHVSAQFPRPTTSRDFVTLAITSDVALSPETNPQERRRRSWMLVSKPCEHEAVPPDQRYVRGQYESVEVLREIIPRAQSRQMTSRNRSDNQLARHGAAGTDEAMQDKDASGAGRKRGKTESTVLDTPDKQAECSDDTSDDENNPVEWIMVTRSDPGGTIPRWMVEKGTPKSIGSDAAKFVDWACQDGVTSDEEVESHYEEKNATEANARQPDDDDDDQDSSSEDTTSSEDESEDGEPDQQQRTGLIASMAYMINSGLERFAPQAVFDYIPHSTYDSSSDVSDSPSTEKQDFARKEEEGEEGEEGERSQTKETGNANSNDAESTASRDKASLSASTTSILATPLVDENGQNIDPFEAMQRNKKGGKLTSHEKHLAKLAVRKREIESRLELVRSEIESLQLHSPESADAKKDKAGMDSDRTSASSVQKKKKKKKSEGTLSSDKTGTKSNHHEVLQVHKAASGLYREESKLFKQLRKVEASQLKAAGKIEARQRKEAEREEKSRSRSEVDGLRREVQDLKKEVDKLRAERQHWLDLVGNLQAENTRLAAGCKPGA